MEVRRRGGGIQGKNSDTSSHTNKIHTRARTHVSLYGGSSICSADGVHQLQLTFYLSELPITRREPLNVFFLSLFALSARSTLLRLLLYRLNSTRIIQVIYTYVRACVDRRHTTNNNERARSPLRPRQKWFLPAVVPPFPVRSEHSFRKMFRKRTTVAHAAFVVRVAFALFHFRAAAYRPWWPSGTSRTCLSPRTWRVAHREVERQLFWYCFYFVGYLTDITQIDRYL